MKLMVFNKIIFFNYLFVGSFLGLRPPLDACDALLVLLLFPALGVLALLAGPLVLPFREGLGLLSPALGLFSHIPVSDLELW